MEEAQKLNQQTPEGYISMEKKGANIQACIVLGDGDDREVFCTQQKTTSCKRTRVIISGDGAKSSAMERAEKVQRNWPSEIPSFIKYMLPSHVAGRSCLSLPKKFCDEHLPKSDSTIILVGKHGSQHKTKYLVRKTRLSGWRGFSAAHHLSEGDVLVFGFIQPTKFMVYIARRNGLDKVRGVSLVFLNLEAWVKQEDFAPKEDLIGEDVKRWREGERKSLNNCLPNIPQENTEECLPESTTELSLEAYQSENDSDGHGPQVLEPAVDFKDVRSIQDFSILVNDLVISSKFPEHLQTKYYELCCSQKTYLHDRLLDGLSHKLAAEIISETVNIADAIRASNLTTCREKFPIWSKTLKAFQELGMNVGFLRARLDQLMSFAFVENRKREARLERMSAEEKIRDLEGSLLHVKEVKKRLDAEIEALNSPAENHEVMFQELAKTPW